MTREEIISGLEFTAEMFLFNPSTGEKYTEPRNDMDKTTIDVCRGAIELLKQEPFINKPCVSSGVCEHDKQKVLDKIRAKITDCLKALDDIENSGLNIYLPNEISGRRLTYQQCLEFIDKYKADKEQENGK